MFFFSLRGSQAPKGVLGGPLPFLDALVPRLGALKPFPGGTKAHQKCQGGGGDPPRNDDCLLLSGALLFKVIFWFFLFLLRFSTFSFVSGLPKKRKNAKNLFEKLCFFRYRQS